MARSCFPTVVRESVGEGLTDRDPGPEPVQMHEVFLWEESIKVNRC